MSSDAPTITPLQANEGALFKTLRLAALTESPDAFSPTLAATEQHDDTYWARAAERFAANPDAALFIARPDLGLGSAVRDQDGIGHIGAMWVSPAARGTGLGAAVLDTAIRFLDDAACEAIELSVTETNTRAIALYESRGFALTGRHEPLREGSPLKNLFMRRPPAQSC